MKKIRNIVTIVLVILPFFIYSQRANKQWKDFKYELIVGGGGSTYMGDIGGGAGDALHYFGAGDLDLSLIRPLAYFGIRLKLLERLSTKFNFAFTYLRGDDAKAQDKGRFNRNLSFRTPLFESSVQLEFSITKDNLKKGKSSNRRRGKIVNINTYIFVGIGGFYFNPEAQLRNTKTNLLEWHNLQPLGTEGQGIGDNPAQYSLFQICYPVGLGFKIPVAETSAIEMEFGFRFTTTDYLDDASNMYYDNNEIKLAYGEVAAALADRHFDVNGNPTDNKYNSGASIRGNPDYNDGYFFITISYVHRIATNSRTSRPVRKPLWKGRGNRKWQGKK